MLENNSQVICGDALTMLKALPNESVNCIVTSPPYYGLRDYGHDGQIGLEQTPQEFIGKLVDVFRECRRVLTKDGTCWVNMGDSYASGGRTYRDADEKLQQRGMSVRPKDAQGIKQKDLLGIPWRLAFALQDDGWYLRQDIIWAKPNPMPESVRDRCTKAHEYIFLLTKSAKYWYDREAVAERAQGGRQFNGSPSYAENDRNDAGRKSDKTAEYRNRRSVWTITPKPFKEAHFAVMPLELARICIKAGCPQGGTVLDPFAGAGTTLVAATQESRSSIGIELNEQYCQLMLARLASITQ